MILILAVSLGLVFCPLTRADQSVTLAWNPSPNPAAVGYLIRYGSDGINFSNQVDAGNNTSWTVTGLPDGSTNYFEVTAYDANYDESPPSNPVEYITPGAMQMPTRSVTVLANPANAGRITGGGAFVTGSSVTVTAAANSGYAFANWTENGIAQSGSPSFSFTIAANRNLAANFTHDADVCTVTPGAGTNGTISPNVPQTIVKGGSVTFTATPAGDCQVEHWLVNGKVAQTGGTAYTLGNVISNEAVAVEFALDTRSPNSLLTVIVRGNGSVTPNLGGQMLSVGSGYSLLAAAANGWVFSNWTSNGVAVEGSPEYAFVMGRGLVLQANFITNPFPGVAGTYQGLFYDTNTAAQQSSGSCNATVTSNGTYTARLQLGLQSFAFSGQFSLAGQSSASIERPGLPPLAVQLQLGLTDKVLTGQVSGGNWTAELMANPVTWSSANPAPQAGNYTLVIPGADDSSAQPGGSGFGSVTVNPAGDAIFSGVLADGTSFACAGMVTGQGLWPFYAPLYAGEGSITGWLAFATSGDISGQLTWIKPAQPAAQYYRAGFTNCTGAIGSVYQCTNGVPVLGFTDGQLTLAGGNLPGNYTEEIELGEQNQGTDSTAGMPVFTVSVSSGLWTGSVMDPQTGNPVSVKGIVLQNQQLGAGFFLGTGQSGQALLVAAPRGNNPPVDSQNPNGDSVVRKSQPSSPERIGSSSPATQRGHI